MGNSNDIYYKTDSEIELIRTSNVMVSKTLGMIAEVLKPGMTGRMIDRLAESYIKDHRGIPSFKGYGGFPATLCVSKNEVVVHGIPDDTEFRDGDIVSVDCGVYYQGYHGDCAFTFAIGDVQDDIMHLLRTTKESLYLAIQQAVAGNRLGDIGFAVQQLTEKTCGYGVVREMVGHGIGRNLHEKPEVPNYGKRGKGMILKEGLVIAIEPMINLGDYKVRQMNDGWTIITRDRKPSAHYEHSVAVRKNAADILSDHSFAENAIKKNPNLREI